MNQFFWPIAAAILSGALVQGGIALFTIGKMAQRITEIGNVVAKLDKRTEGMPGGCPLHTGRNFGQCSVED